MIITNHAVERLVSRFDFDTADIKCICGILSNKKAYRTLSHKKGGEHRKFNYKKKCIIAVVKGGMIITFKYTDKEYEKMKREEKGMELFVKTDMFPLGVRKDRSSVSAMIEVINNHGVQTVNARELHEFLESKQDFSTWIKNRISRFDFCENIDFTRFHKKMEANNATIIEYFISIDMAKELSMVENNEKGKQARRYFIEIERKAKSLILPNFHNPAEAARAWANEYEQKQLAENKIKELLPKAEFYDQVTNSKDAIDIGSAAKVLDMGIGRNKLFELLREKKILMDNNQPYQKYIDCEYFRTIEQKYTMANGSTSINIKTVVYQKGLDFIRRVLNND